MTIRLSQADLNYLLQQVLIGTDYTKLFGPLDPGGVREVSGANNNLVGGYDSNGNWVPATNIHGDWGQADTDFLRLSLTNTPGTGNVWGTTYDTVTVLPGTTTPNVMGSIVTDAMPRLISNLISSSVVNTDSLVYNPAAVAARDAIDNGYTVDVNNSVVGSAQGAGMPDQGILGGVPFNEFFVAFGQFFDHGLDFISKDGGYVMITLSPGDPLYVSPTLENGDPNPQFIDGASNVMMLSRASLSNPDSDFTNGVLNAGVTPQFNNNTGLLIDQSQTYGSQGSINALVRQYDADGRPTGLLITSAEDGKVMKSDGAGGYVAMTDAATLEKASHDLATWADMQANALRIGIQLVDMDVIDAPSIRTNAAGDLAFDSSAVADLINGGRAYYLADETLAEMATRTGQSIAVLQAHDPFLRDVGGNVLHSNQAILTDMGFGASPAGTPGLPGYDSDWLARHYVSGDGRVNENVGLTAVHHIFHEEHNIEVHAIEDSVLQVAAGMALGGDAAGASAYVNAWTRSTGTTGSVSVNYVDAQGAAHTVMVGGVNVSGAAVAWDGNKVYQASRIITETEYNHIAIDQYVGSLAALPEFVSYSADINMSVSLEFSQAVFRLGHSMLTEQMQIGIDDVNGVHPGQPGWIPTYNNQDLFNVFINPDAYTQFGAQGITIGLMRQGSNTIDEFVTPALQQSLLGTPLDLAALNIARGRDVGLPTLNELRQQIYNQVVVLNGSSGSGSAIAPYTSWADFGGHLRTPESLVNFIAAYGRDDTTWHLESLRQAYLSGSSDPNDPTPDTPVTLEDLRTNAQRIVDAYADAADPMHAAAVTFMYGTPVYNPATHSVDSVGADLGFWDVDLWVGGLAERPLFDGPLGTTFSMIMLDFGQRMQDGDRFYYLYRMPVGQHLGDQIIGEQFADLIQRTTNTQHVGDAFGHQTGFFELGDGDDVWQSATAGNFAGTDMAIQDGHIVVAGNGGNDYIAGGLGDDYLYGDDGDDTLNGSQGNDHLYGGAGNDFITDDENDDFIDGGDGDDIIFAGPGVLDTSHGGRGNDEVHGGDGVDEVFGDDGDDSLFGEGDTDLIVGGDGNDYLDGGDSVDEMFGGNGNDWLRGGVGDDNINGGSGNDLMEGGLGPTANDGDRLNGDSPITAGTTVIEYNGDGTEGDMDIASYEDVQIAIYASLQDSNANGTSSNLMDTYAYVEGLVGSAQNDRLIGADADTTTSNGPNNYLIGGGGNDILTGLGGNDYIFGDSVVVDNYLYWIGDPRHAGTGQGAVTGQITQWGEIRPTFEHGSPGHVLGDAGTAGDQDVAVFRGRIQDYSIEHIQINGMDAYRVTDLRDPASTIDPVTGVNTFDGTDILVDIEIARFSNGDKLLGNEPPVAANDRLVLGTNGPLDVPQWALLANDTDPDNDPLTIVGISGQTGLTASLVGAAVRVSYGSGNQHRFDYTVSDGTSTDSGRVSVSTDTSGTLSGSLLSEIIVDGSSGRTISAGLGDDIIFAGGGNDNITWSVTNPIFGFSLNDGRDYVDGGAGTDTFTVNGNNTAENFVIYGPNSLGGFSGLRQGTEIVITRNGSIIAELTNVEDIVINTGPGNDNVSIVGNFDASHLATSTITIEGNDGDDTVDIQGLTSSHRVVFNGGAGNDSVVGTLRAQDVFNQGDGSTAPGNSGGHRNDDGNGNGNGNSGNGNASSGATDDRSDSQSNDHSSGSGGKDHTHEDHESRISARLAGVGPIDFHERGPADPVAAMSNVSLSAASVLNAAKDASAAKFFDVIGSGHASAVVRFPEYQQDTGDHQMRAWHAPGALDALFEPSSNHHHEEAPTGRDGWFGLL